MSLAPNSVFQLRLVPSGQADDQQDLQPYCDVEALALRFGQSLELPSVLDEVAQQVAALFDGVCQVHFKPAGRPSEARRVVASRHAPPLTQAETAAAETYMALLRQLCTGEAAEDGSRERDGPAGCGAELLLAPMIARGRRIGAIDVVRAAGDSRRMQRSQALLRSLAAHAALAIDNADRFSRLHPPGDPRAADGAAADLSRLLAMLSHDLRGPLATLSSGVQLLVRELADGQELDRSKVARLTDMVEAAVAQLEGQVCALTPERADGAGRERSQGQNVDLVKLTRLMANFYQQTTGRHRLTVCAAVPELWGPWARPQIERVLANLLVNAIKYSPGGGEINVALMREDDSCGSWASLSVQNHGIGILPQDLPRLSRAGYRGCNVGAIPGTGFGLASVREVVEQHGGSLAIQSTLGELTTVVIRLPLQEG